MRARLRGPAKRLAAPLLLVVPLLLVAGCGGAASDESDGAAGNTHESHSMPDGTVMKDSEMSGMDMESQDGGQAPSSAAKMICSDETAAAVQRNFALRALPRSTSSWTDRTYRCRYQLPGGALDLTVKDLTQAGPGRTWFNQLRDRLPGARAIGGMQSFGFPAFETARGDVGFLKDHKTLWVDASGVPGSDLPPGFTRTATAYGVAAAVVACWTE